MPSNASTRAAASVCMCASTWEYVSSVKALVACPNCSETTFGGTPAESNYRTSQVMATLLKRRIRVQGFIIFEDYGSHFGEFRKQMTEWFEAGKIKYREDIVSGLENAPEAFMGLLQGKNFGKLVVRVAAEAGT